VSTAPSGHTIVIASRFCGPPVSGNGGYVSGRLAAFVTTSSSRPAVEVTLRSPPPLDLRMTMEPDADGAVALRSAKTLVARAQSATMFGEPPRAIDFARAEDAAAGYAGRHGHPFPTCFGCGLDRPVGDGMRLQPGPVGESTVAASWQPDASLADADGVVAAAFVWAALDCPSGWATDLVGHPKVLGRMTGQVESLPRVGEPYVIVAALRRLEGRKAFTSSALYDASGGLLGRAESIWLEVDPAEVRPASA
jgi:hypothetical protein